MHPGAEIALAVDQTLTQDATGTLVMLELEALGLDRVRTEISVQYVDHNLLQADSKNQDDHLFLRSACRRFGLWYSKPGNGVSHPVHMQRFGIPGKVLAGSDSHTCAAGSLGMLAIGTGGLDVAMAMAGEPLYLRMPEIWGIELTGALPAWVSAKDVVLEMLRRHGVKGGVNRIIEYHGDGLAGLTVMDRHVIANMGAELGATTTVFPSDEAVLEFLRAQGREQDYTELRAEPGRLRRHRQNQLERAGTADRDPVEPRQRGPGPRGRRAADLPGLHRFLGQPRLSGLRHGRGDREKPQPMTRSPSTSIPRHGKSWPTWYATATCWSSSMPAPASTRLVATAASAWDRPRRPNASACAPCPATSPAGPAPTRTRSASLAGDRRRRRADRRDHRPPRPGRPLPRGSNCPGKRRSTPRCSSPRSRLTTHAARSWSRTEHRHSLPEFDPLSDHLEATAELKVADDVSTDEILRPAPRCCRCAATSPRSPGSRSGSSTRTTRTVPPPRRARTW